MAEFTVAGLEAIIPKALAAGDMKAVECCLWLLAVQDPHLAQRYVDMMKLGLAIAQEERCSRCGAAVAEPIIDLDGGGQILLCEECTP